MARRVSSSVPKRSRSIATPRSAWAAPRSRPPSSLLREAGDESMMLVRGALCGLSTAASRRVQVQVPSRTKRWCFPIECEGAGRAVARWCQGWRADVLSYANCCIVLVVFVRRTYMMSEYVAFQVQCLQYSRARHCMLHKMRINRDLELATAKSR